MSRLAKVAMGLFGVLLIGAWYPLANAQTADQLRSKVNQNVVGIMAGTPGSTDMALASDLNLAFSGGYDLRIIPMVGQGSVRDVEDLMYLRGVDMAVVQQDVLDFMKQNSIYSGIDQSVRLIAPVSIDQFHVLARQDVTTIYALAGQKVNFGPNDTGTFMTSSVVFEALGVDVEVMTYPHQIALEKLRNGEIAAMMRASAKPVPLITEVRADEPLSLLAVPTEPLAGTYSATTLTSQDYPGLVDPNQPVPTVAVANTLIGYNWPREHPRGQALALFTKRFFGQYNTLLEDGYHETWQEIDVTSEVPGLERHWSAEEALRAASK